MFAVRGSGDDMRISLGSNPDVTLDLLDALAAAGKPRPLLVGVLHPAMPFMGHGAEVPAASVDVLLCPQNPPTRLFALPREPVDLTEYTIGLHTSALVRDGGTLQIGIGALSDALVQALLLRQHDNGRYRDLLKGLDVSGGTATLADFAGGLVTFEKGMYGASEMVMDGFMHLRCGGILRRQAYDDLTLERALSEGTIGPVLDGESLERLYAQDAWPEQIDAAALARLQWWGMLPADARVDAGRLVLSDGREFVAVMSDRRARQALATVIDGRHVAHGRYLRGQSDEDCIKAMLAITDARFIDELGNTARKAGKLASDFHIPGLWRATRRSACGRPCSPHASPGCCRHFRWAAISPRLSHACCSRWAGCAITPRDGATA